MRRRAALGLGFLALAAAVSPAGALADPGDQYENRGVTSLEPNITQFEKNIEPLQDVATDGGSTTITLETDILFGFGESTLPANAEAKIGDIVAQVPQGVTVSVDGHTDSVPAKKGNDVLSKERAQAVADAISKARPDLHLQVAGHGETQPVAANERGGEDDPVGRAKNRRVEIRYGS